MRTLSHFFLVWWGAHPRLLLQIFRLTFRSFIEYGGQIFQFRGNSQGFLKLRRLVCRCIRVALGYRNSTPINVMLYESKESPLEIRISHIFFKYIYKALSNKSNSSISYLEILKGELDSSHDKINLIKNFPIFGTSSLGRQIENTSKLRTSKISIFLLCYYVHHMHQLFTNKTR